MDEIILAIKEAISELPLEKQAKCKEFASMINVASKGWEDCMILTVALIGATLQAEDLLTIKKEKN